LSLSAISLCFLSSRSSAFRPPYSFPTRRSSDLLTGNILMQYVVLLIGVALLTYIVRYFWRIMIFGASYRLGRILRNRLYRKYSRSEEHTSELKSRFDLVCRLLLEKKKQEKKNRV